MANIATLAMKVSADIGNFTKDIAAASELIQKMDKVVQATSPSMRNLKDAAQGYGTMLSAVAEAQKRVNEYPLLENQTALRESTELTEKLRNKLGELAEKAPDDILKMKPTLSNIQKAQEQLENLKQIAESTGQTELFAGAIERATKNIQTLTANTVQAQTEMESFKSVIFGFQNLPFQILLEIFKDVKKWFEGFAEKFDSKMGGWPSLILKLSAAFAGLIILLGTMQTQMGGLVASTAMWRSLWGSSVIVGGLKGIIVLLNSILGTQWAINAATLTWVSILTFGVAALVAGAIAGIATLSPPGWALRSL